MESEKIPNPDYNGPWVHPEIPNPDYQEESEVYKRGEIGYMGIEVWQVKSGTVFGDFLLTNSVDEARSFLEERKVAKEAEEAAKKAYDDANRPPEEEHPEEDDEEDKTDL